MAMGQSRGYLRGPAVRQGDGNEDVMAINERVTAKLRSIKPG